MLIVPTQATPSQTIEVPLGGQNVQLALYQKATGLYMDVAVNSAPIVNGVLCENLNLIVRSAYLGFIGDFMWIDNQAAMPQTGADPIYTGLGGRFSLAYLETGDIPVGLEVGVS